MPILMVSHGKWADPVAPPPDPPSDADLFLVTRSAGGGGLVRIKANGIHEVLYNHGHLLDAGMGQAMDMFSDIYTGFAFRYAHSTDGGVTWTNAGTRPAEPYEVVLINSLVSPDVLVAVGRSTINTPPPSTTKAVLNISSDVGATSSVLEEVTTAPSGATSGTYLNSVGEWAMANASGVWWGIEEKDFGTGAKSSHLRKTPIAGGPGSQISLSAHLSSNDTTVSTRGYANHDDTDSALFHTTNAALPADRKLFKVVGTTVTNLMSALNDSFTGAYDLSGSTLYVGSEGKIKKSTNGGTSFTDVFTPSLSPLKLRISQTDPNIIVAMLAGYEGMCYSTDGGSTWLEVAIPSAGLSFGIDNMVVY